MRWFEVGFWPRSGATASYIQITGNADTLPADTVAKVYLAVVRGEGGDGSGGGLTETEVNTLIAAAEIDTDQLEGEIDQDQLADNTGIREYVGQAFMHDSANDRITGTIQGLDAGDTFERYSRMIAFSPDPLGRQGDALRMVVHTVNLPLVDRDGQAVSARQITPGRLYEILQGFSSFAFIQPLGLRPQDYRIRVAVSPDTAFTSVEILAGTQSPVDSNAVSVPVYDDYVGSVRVTEGGSGYSSAPAVAFAGGDGTGAAATAVVGAASGVERIFVRDIGFNFTSNPTVVFSGGGGTGASATAVIQSNGQLSDADVTLTNGGSGYTSAPTVTLVGGGGTAPRVSAFLETDAGRVTEITVTNRGSGYTSRPDITLTGGGGTGAEARAELGEFIYIAIGVPDDTGDITGIIHDTANLLSEYERIAGTINVDGILYKFWRSTGRMTTSAFGDSAND